MVHPHVFPRTTTKAKPWGEAEVSRSAHPDTLSLPSRLLHAGLQSPNGNAAARAQFCSHGKPEHAGRLTENQPSVQTQALRVTSAPKRPAGLAGRQHTAPAVSSTQCSEHPAGRQHPQRLREGGRNHPQPLTASFHS